MALPADSIGVSARKVLNVDTSTVELGIGEQHKLKITTSELTYRATFDPEGIALIDTSTNIITALKIGKATLTVSVDDNLAEQIEVIVKELPPKDIDNIMTHTSGHFEKVQLIEDGVDLVDARSTNRPHKSVIGNLDIVASKVDVNEFKVLGTWNRATKYKEGDIVVFLTEFFICTKENIAEAPIPYSIGEQSQYWRAVSNASDIQIENYTTIKRQTNQVGTRLFYPITNGKDIRTFTLQAGKVYEFLHNSYMSALNEQYGLYLDFSQNISSYGNEMFPKVSYVEMDVKYIGVEEDRLPKINFGQCIAMQDNTTRKQPTTLDEWYDIYGHYGLSVQSCLNELGTVSIQISTRWNCSLTVVGKYRKSPYISEIDISKITYSSIVNHLVRPYGGSQVIYEVGEVITPIADLSLKQLWDKGCFPAKCLGNDDELTKNEYSLLCKVLGKDKITELDLKNLNYIRAF